MDKLYIGDIPSDYHYAVFSGDYITLYNKSSGNNETLDYYRIFTNDRGFYYTKGTTNFNYYTTYFDDIEVTDNFLYRRDFPDILFCVLVFSLFFIFLINIFTSVFKRGGVLGGLL